MEIIKNNAQFIDLIYYIIMIVIFGVGLYSLFFQKRGNQYSTIKDCIDIHRGLMSDQHKLKEETNLKSECHKNIIIRHLGLITDEIFYMNKGYLPRKISKDWLANMVNFIPIYCKGKIINEKEISKSKELSDYIKLDKKNYKEYIDLFELGGMYNKIRTTFTIKESLYTKMILSMNINNNRDIVKYLWRKIKKNKRIVNKNSYRLTKKQSKNSYDWWWHSLVATNVETGELKPFFIEYFVVNPGLWNGNIVWGQKTESKENKQKPCYAMLKVGTWGKDKAQLHNYYDILKFYASKNELNCKIGDNKLSENSLSGEVKVSKQDCINFPERMSDSGALKWDLKVEKDVKFDVGYGSSKLFNSLGAFHMYWHAQGMRCKYTGEIIFNDQKYIVHPKTSYGYQDKNWGKDYTNPWIWLNCNNFKSKNTRKKIDASFDLGGGCPKVFGVPLPQRILTAFYYKGEFIEFNFAKFWKKSKQQFDTQQDEKYFYWNVISVNKKYKIEVKFKCEKSKMLFVNYENPDGIKNHNKLWNGGNAEGSLKLYKKDSKYFKLIDELEGSLGGCEYGEY